MFLEVFKKSLPFGRKGSTSKIRFENETLIYCSDLIEDIQKEKEIADCFSNIKRLEILVSNISYNRSAAFFVEMLALFKNLEFLGFVDYYLSEVGEGDESSLDVDEIKRALLEGPKSGLNTTIPEVKVCKS